MPEEPDITFALAHLRAYPPPGDGTARHDLARIRDLRLALEKHTAEEVRAARAAGQRWADIAPFLGVSRQIASARYGP